MWRRVEMGNETIVEKGCRSGKKPNNGRTKQIVQRNEKCRFLKTEKRVNFKKKQFFTDRSTFSK